MSDIIEKAQESLAITENQSLPPWQRIWPALHAFSGLRISNLDNAARKGVEAEMIAVNRISAAYEIEEEGDHKKLTDSEVHDILSHISTAIHLCIASESDRVMKELDSAGRQLPIDAIMEVREHPDICVPLLIRSVEQAILRIRKGDEVEGDLHFFAMFLLTELKATESYPILLEALRLPGEGAFELLGDGVHELFAPMVALVSDGDTDVIRMIVEDSKVNFYVRWTAAEAYKYLVRDERISREVAVDALHRHFRECVANNDHEMLAPLACELGDLAAETALDTIRSAYQRKLVDQSIVRLALIETQVAAGEKTIRQELAHCRPTGMPDTIEELSGWHAFRTEEPRPRPLARIPQSPHFPRPNLLMHDTIEANLMDGERHKVGRNDPCPCGSGKKFKKCCL